MYIDLLTHNIQSLYFILIILLYYILTGDYEHIEITHLNVEKKNIKYHF